MTLYLLHTSSVTDWIIAFTAVFGTIGVFCNLRFLNKQSKSSQDQINELTKQSKEAQNQTKIFNEILDLYSSDFLKDEENKKEAKKLKQQERLNKIKPYFTSRGGSSYGRNDFNLTLINNGGMAQKLFYTQISLNDLNIPPFSPDAIINMNAELIIIGTYYGNKLFNNVTPFKFTLEYSDNDDNKYFQEISREGPLGELKVGFPQLRSLVQDDKQPLNK